MTLGRYAVPDLPTRGAGAFCPSPPPVVCPPSLSSWGLVRVDGSPELEVPAPKPSTSVIRAGPLGTSVTAMTMPSNVSPDFIFPDRYIPKADNMGPQAGAAGVRVRNFNDIPVPAVNIFRVVARAQTPPTKLGGRAVTPWPRALPRWPSVTQPKSTPGPRW